MGFGEVINPKTVKVLEGHGMPHFRGNEHDRDPKYHYGPGRKEKGDLILKFTIVFPKELPETSKVIIRDLLG